VASARTFGAKLRYRFDNALARGPIVVIAYLGLLSLVIMVITAAIAIVGRLEFGGARESGGFGEDVWQALLRTLDSGAFAGDSAWPTRVLALFTTLAGIFLAGSLIGLIANAVDQKVEDLRKGTSPVIESGHTLILGWSPQVPRIISELIVANESEKKASIVVLAGEEKTVMEDALRDRVGDTRTTRLVCRSGNRSAPADLHRAAIESARSIVVVREDDGDAGVVKAVLAVRAVDNELAGAHVVAELFDPDNARTIRTVTAGRVLTVSSDDVVAEVTAQACLQSGLALVFTDLLDFDGDEMYFFPVGSLAGRPYRDALLGFERSSVVGRITGDGVVQLNPEQATVLEPDDQLILVAEDDAALAFSGVIEVPDVPSVPRTPSTPAPMRILIVGWSGFGAKVLHELDEFLPAGSHIDLAIDEQYADPSAVTAAPMAHADLTVHAGDGGPDALLALAQGDAPDQVIVLGYRDALSIDDADAKTLLTLLTLRTAWPADGAPHVRIVAELLDQRNLALAAPVGVDDLIVSDALASLLMAQLAERAELQAVFDELFDASGSSVELRPAPQLVRPGTHTYAAVVAATSMHDASPIGYRLASGEVVVNPPKSQVVTLGEHDQVIVIAERDRG
jgi:Trk K+ transport system NAD-binding subunit